jgi:hypothetical protein
MANAAFVFFNVPGLHAGESARVAEQIVCANIACTVLDYQFYVANTGAIGIDGFALGLGAVPGVIPQADTALASAAGGGDGPFPAQPGFVNFGTAVLGPCALIACGPVGNGPAAWGFEEFQDPGTLGGLPATFYVTRWYNPVQGFNAGCGVANLNLVAANAAGVLCPGQYSRFDLITTYPPAGGNGAVDPPGDTPFIGFDDIGNDPGGNVSPEFDLDSDASGSSSPADDWSQPCDPETSSCGTPATSPTADSVFAADSSQFSESPEPSTSLIAGAGLIVAAGLLRRRKRAA